MDQIINASLQVLPSSKEEHPYDIVDKAINIIKESGLKYMVCPFETVIEGGYDDVMAVIKKVHTHLLQQNITSVFSYIKIQIQKDNNVAIEDKMHKYL